MAAIIPVSAFTDNYIWLLHQGGRAVVVDPGDDEPVMAALASGGLVLDTILCTHHHGDHVGGVEDLVARFRVPVLGPAGETIPCRTRALDDGDEVVLPAVGASFRVLHVPGHTRGHIAFAGRVGDDDVVFCGDTLFAGGCGRLFEGTARQMWSSLSRLAALPAATRVYCAHEYTLANLAFAQAVEPDSAPLAARVQRERDKRVAGRPTVPSTIGEERATNPFLRVDVAAVKDAAQRHAGRALGDEVEVFAAVRSWKDGFRAPASAVPD
jgi:hydroxyacylglutathione hydrolase